MRGYAASLKGLCGVEVVWSCNNIKIYPKQTSKQITRLVDTLYKK